MMRKRNPVRMAGAPLLARDEDRVGFPSEKIVELIAPILAHPLTRGANFAIFADLYGNLWDLLEPKN
jgi:hypothetical protein